MRGIPAASAAGTAAVAVAAGGVEPIGLLCARAATVGVGARTSGSRGRRDGEIGGGESSRRWQRFLDRIREDVGGEWRRSGEPRTQSRGPHRPFIALCDGGPPTTSRLGSPDQGAWSRGPISRWANWDRDQSNSPDLILATQYTLYQKTSSKSRL